MRILSVGSIGVALALVALVLAGCEQSSDGGSSDMDNLANQLEQNKQAQVAADAAAAAAKAKADELAAKAEEARLAAERKAAEDEAAKAQLAAQNETSITITVKNPQGLLNSAAGQAAMTEVVGKKQRKNRVEGGPLQYYGAIANARIIAMDRTLGWQIKSALDGFVHGENDGKYPKDTEEFMKRVIEPNGIELPELEPNQQFYFDPESHELVIAELVDEPAAGDTLPPTQ